MSKKNLLILALLITILSISGIAFAQEETLRLVDALSIVRETYGDDVVVTRATGNDELNCWSFDLADGIRTCVNMSTGEFIDLPAAETPFSIPPALLFAGLIGAIVLVYILFRQSAKNQADTANTVWLDLQISYSINRITWGLAGIAIYLATQSIVFRWIQENFDNPPHALNRFVRLVNINLEKSLPTWYATVLLLIASVSVFIIANSKAKVSYGLHWFSLSAIFLYLSIDEATAIHEELTIPLRDVLGTGGFLHFAWVIVGAIVFLIIALTYVRFVFHLPAPVRNLVILGGATFVGGALLIESISASFYAQGGATLTYSAIGTVEEFFEMLGVILFIRAMFLYLQLSGAEVQIGSVQDTSSAESS